MDHLPVPAYLQRFVHVHSHQVRQGMLPNTHPVGVFSVPGTVALRARYRYVRQKLHIQIDGPGAIAYGTAQLARII